MTHAHRPSKDSLNEMHELNAEADLLEQKMTVIPGGANGEDARLQSQNSDPDAQAMVIDSLRTQIQDLFSQVSQLNNKLVRSYDRVSDLEDELHMTSSNLRQATLKVSQLELERSQHLSALSTGLLVEKSHVTSELTRLMEKATEEAARRGQAESARAEIEKDLDDLSAGLFGQANTMVAEARIAEAKSARKLEDTEAALRSAEEVVGALQSQMQMLESEKEKADRRVEEMRIRMGKGKWVDRSPHPTSSSRPRLLSVHVPYHEFLLFVSHLRVIRPATAHPPAMSTLLPLPFLARLVSEDSDPTVRLDLAPSLNWLSRRSVLAAIHSGQLTIEPMQFNTLLEELAPSNIPASSHYTHVVCALCGAPIYSSSSDSPGNTPTTPNATRTGSQSLSWSTNLFKTVRASDLNLTGHNRHSVQHALPSTECPSQIYIFRPDVTSSGLPVSLPLSSQQSGAPTRQAIYPLCINGWCLARLRTTCSLWAFVRSSIVEKVWEEPPITVHINGTSQPGVNGVEKTKHDGTKDVAAGGEHKPTTPIQPPLKKAKVGFGSLWGSMQRSLSGTREPEKPKEAEQQHQQRDDGKPMLPPRDPSRKTLPPPPPPPTHPSVSHAPNSSVSSEHRVPPPLKMNAPAATSAPAPAGPPPLPKRNRGREARAETPDLERKVEINATVSGYAIQSDHQTVEQSQDVPTESSGMVVIPAPQTQVAAPLRDEPQEAQGGPVASVRTASHSSPAISRVTSDDSFTTPTEELAPQRISSLPSSKKTPINEEPPTPDPSVSPSEPVESAAPVLAGSPDEANGLPSRTGSPVPPPLPRRAAARARPLSTLASQSMDLAKGEVASESVVEEIATEQSNAAAPAAEAEESQEATTHIVEPAPLIAEPEPMVHSDSEEVVAPPPNGDSVPEAPLPAGEASEEIGIQNSSAGSSVNGDATSTEQTKVSASEPRPVGVVAEEADEDKEHGPTAAEGQGISQFVGDATWEERTYQEVIRLRQEMFWARIGAMVH